MLIPAIYWRGKLFHRSFVNIHIYSTAWCYSALAEVCALLSALILNVLADPLVMYGQPHPPSISLHAILQLMSTHLRKPPMIDALFALFFYQFF